ncbi:hypothetical protein [Kibdelosporangium phytohabitans]|uniref:Uncharacterized protein n=1 Tax=Kibdelosporangium phytohabitans TaxID=860235 RepID=A0A0N9I0E6_9PSEU|nr:hypothetical protein [Kibdelosporangium phytohabitans]ALG07648.1 hypothetical protein AOZ06_12675 [Kibdelosporangium phytohabitans]ALG07704.1 hypothetical protein AOZ06_12995 [Kibdelosporangium phytohabitans]MBE1471398.1 crossover junction endodeoxyribonuclease RusA [Kibdelosporangium phytohabitans]
MPDTTAAPTVYEIDVPMIPTRRGAMVPPLTANMRLHWRAEAHRIRNVRELVANTANDAGIPQCQHLTVQLHYRPGDNRRRDADNLYPTFKAACDALARGPRRDWVGLELVPDDTPEHMTKLAPVIHPGPGDRRLWLTVEVTR